MVWPRSEVSAPGPGVGSKQPPEWPPGVINAGGRAAPCGEPVRAAEAGAAARKGETFGKAVPLAAASPDKATARARACGLIAPWTTLYLLCYQSKDVGPGVSDTPIGPSSSSWYMREGERFSLEGNGGGTQIFLS